MRALILPKICRANRSEQDDDVTNKKITSYTLGVYIGGRAKKNECIRGPKYGARRKVVITSIRDGWIK